MSLKPTAMGVVLLIVPELSSSPRRWMVIAFNAAGNWTSGRTCESKAEAVKERARLRRWHKKLAAIYEAKRRKRK